MGYLIWLLMMATAFLAIGNHPFVVGGLLFSRPIGRESSIQHRLRGGGERFSHCNSTSA